MKVAIIGTRHISGTILPLMLSYLPNNVTQIVSGGAAGVDKAAEQLAVSLSLPLKLFLPDYTRYGRRAPFKRNLEIIQYADEILAFWDGSSKGTMYTIAACIRCGKPVRIIPVLT